MCAHSSKAKLDFKVLAALCQVQLGLMFWAAACKHQHVEGSFMWGIGNVCFAKILSFSSFLFMEVESAFDAKQVSSFIIRL